MNNIALITGVGGQDGSYLAELLLSKGYEVHGAIRRTSYANVDRLNTILDKINLHYSDITDSNNLTNLVKTIKPTEIYNLAAQSHVQVSFEMAEYTTEVNALGILKILNAVLSSNYDVRIYQASTSEMFGKVQTVPQLETTPFYPRSPYGVSKLYAHWIVKNYRESYGLHASSGILFNHESPRRGETFVTQKIVKGFSNIKNKKQKYIELGNLNAKRDWGHAKDFVEAMWLMLQQPSPDDYVIATGEQHSVKDFIKLAAPYFDMDITWEGEGLDEVGIDQNGNVRIKINPKYFRPADVESLLGDSTKARKTLGWAPKINFSELVMEMSKNA